MLVDAQKPSGPEDRNRTGEDAELPDPSTIDPTRVDTTKVFFTDLAGRLKSVSINPRDLPRLCKEGTGIDGSSIPGLATVDESDMLLKPMEQSLRLLEFEDRTIGFLVGRLFGHGGERSRLDARAILEGVVKRAESEHGVRFLMGPEHEFFLLEEDEFESASKAHIDKVGYFGTTPGDAGEPIRQEIVDVLARCGIRYEKMHHEVTPSQQEINLECGPPVEVADRTLLFTHVAKEVAYACDLHATFMSKPFDHLNRNAFHIHLSMQDLEGRNLFHDPDGPGNMSRKARHFIGGILAHARESSIIMASTLNSYKAYILDREAPVVRGWGLNNRSSMVRVPYAPNPEATRIELRNPDATGNVYLQFAVYIAMGLAGIEKEIDPGEPDSGNNYENSEGRHVYDQRYLPRDFYEALMEAERSSFLEELLGRDLFRNYLELEREDWEYHRAHITDRERSRYLSI